jgi:hypothetical protein
MNCQAKGIQATKVIRGFLGLLLIVGAVAALAQEKSAPAETAPTKIVNRSTGIGPRRAT